MKNHSVDTAKISAASNFVKQTIAIWVHYLVLSVFFWNGAMAWDLYKTFGKQAIISRLAALHKPYSTTKADGTW